MGDDGEKGAQAFSTRYPSSLGGFRTALVTLFLIYTKRLCFDRGLQYEMI